MKSEKKNIFTGIRLDENLRNALQKLADEDERTLSDYIRKELKKLVQSKNKDLQQNQ